MLERLSVLIVEDSGFARHMLSEILRALKVGRIQVASEGGEAIAQLKQIGRNKAAASALGFDLILSDHVMSPINGAMLLRWVRQHEESPDRFVPFVMVSGAADGDKVREARDLGVSEFLAKPFSVKTVADHVLAVIDGPRPFWFTRDYFGPDRRRQRRPWSDVERRTITREEIEIVYSGQRLKPLSPKIKAFHFQLPNRLREKIAGLGQSGPLTIDTTVLAAAEQQLDRMEGDYADWVRGTMNQLADAARAAAAEEIPRKRAAAVIAINRLAHDLRGQGSTFGYPLITVFGKSLYECTQKVDEPSDQLVEFVRNHIDGINAVVREKIKGTGGDLGAELVRSLENARAKLSTV